MRQWKIDTLVTEDQCKLRYGIYAQEDLSQIREFIIFINGHGEYIEKYSYLPEDLKVPEHCAFLTWDHRGQGASEGEPRLHIEDYEFLAKDAQFLLNKIVGDKKYSIVSHSMGGLITLYSTMKGYLKPEKVVMSAPLFGIQHALPESVGKTLGRFLTCLGLGKIYFQNKLQKPDFESNLFTYSKERYEKRYNSPFRIEGITLGWIASTFNAIDFIGQSSRLTDYKKETLIILGDDERLVSVKAIQKWVDRARQLKNPVRLEIINRARHEVFAEAPESYKKVIDLTRSFVFES